MQRRFMKRNPEIFAFWSILPCDVDGALAVGCDPPVQKKVTDIGSKYEALAISAKLCNCPELRITKAVLGSTLMVALWARNAGE
jgi:hypothetical protein